MTRVARDRRHSVRRLAVDANDVRPLPASRGGHGMQDPSGSMELPEPEENGQRTPAVPPAPKNPTLNPDADSTTASTVLAEVLPGIAVVFGEVPPELEADLIDFGLVPAADRTHIAAVLSS